MKLKSSLNNPFSLLYLAPLIDAFGLLLIFFLLGSQFTLRSGTSIELPPSPFSINNIAEAHILTILSESPPFLLLNEQKIAIHSLSEELTKLKATHSIDSVVIHADKNISHGFLMNISNIILQQDFTLVYATVPRPSQ